MTFTLSLFRGALVLLVGLALSGCLPSAQSQSEEERESHFLTGKNRVSALDYKGAIEAFEKALEANPHSASAHFELGCLFDQKEPDPAAAIYHYEHYLKLRSEAENAEVVKQHIMACKQELAKTVSLGPVSEKVQRDLEQLSQENKRLTEQNKQLQEELEKWRAYAARISPTSNPPRTGVLAAGQPVSPGSTSAANVDRNRQVVSPGAGSRTHQIKAGETPTMIARRYGIKVESLMAANPAVNPRRLQVGQALVIPANSP